MSRITVTEKQHWKERIEHRISKAIAEIEAQDPSLMPTLRARAEELAHEALGTLEHHQKLNALRSNIKSLEDERDQTERVMWLHALGADALRSGEYHARSSFWTLHSKHTARIENEQLKHSPLGLKILALKSEKESLLDTVWLATSSKQIRDLWGRVSSVLGEESTPLQQQILAEPSDDAANNK
jgi:hypothetical protein